MSCDILKTIFSAVALLCAVSACGSESDVGAEPEAVTLGPCSPGGTVTCACTDGTLSTQVCNPAGTGYEACQCESGTALTPQSSGSGAGAGAGGELDGLPCDVAEVLEQSCWGCHGEQPMFGAPMSLVSASDFRAPSLDPSMTVGEMVRVRIHDDADPMPQPPTPRLSSSEAAVLENWISAGAPGQTCQSSSSTAPEPTDPSEPVPPDTTAPPDSTAPAPEPEPPPDPSVQCYELRAHDPGVTTGFNVPQTPDVYTCFTFAPPWGTAPVHLVSSRALIDNDRVLHHWILYNNSGGVPDGGISGCSGAHPDAQFVAGWAPGGDDTELPPDVGMAMPGAGFTLEIHYNNNAGTQFDASGVELCVTDQLRPNVAAIHWLGTESINLPAGGDATGTCNPNNTEPVTIISSSPHMHLQGRHMTTVINRAGGGQEVLLDMPFTFDAQVSYPTPATIYPGDTLTTTCTYGGPAYFGQGTNQEMCYNFVLAYPAGQLAQSSSFLRQNNCTGF